MSKIPINVESSVYLRSLKIYRLIVNLQIVADPIPLKGF
ncbi:hypothetical protein HS7_12410 [Sulfolobales archaeon HS-7]|nr:hypothetical protein HS7_12410 [Sulfolobales archaeon HS-7]